MKKITMSLLAIAAMSTALVAGGDIAPVIEVAQPVAEKNFYVGGGITANTIYLDGQKDYFDDQIDSEIAGGLEIKAGYVFYRADAVTVAVEAQAGRTFWGFEVDNDDVYSYDYAAFIKPAYSFGDFGVYGLVGFAKSAVTDGDVTIQENGFAYGVGATYTVVEDVELYVDYTMLPAFTEDGFADINNDKIAFGATYSF